MDNCLDETYRSITKKEIGYLFLFGGILGIVAFIYCYGWKVLDVTYVDWLYSGNDISQHYIGWKFFRESDWMFPIGCMNNIIYPLNTCIIFTDSIPLFALFFKILSPILPETFQYFGIWGCFTYFLNGALSAVIIRKATPNHIYCYVGSGFFIFSPWVFHRMYGHTALAGHWIILLCILVWMYKPYFSTVKRKVMAWTLILMLGSLVHIYFIPMVMLFMMGFCLQDFLETHSWKVNVLIPLISVFVDVLVLYVVGGFSRGGSLSDGGLGVYSANLNSLFNSNGNTRFFGALPFNHGQDEGFGYLGIGIIFLLGCVVGICVLRSLYNKKFKIKHWTFYASLCFTSICILWLACSPMVTFGNRTLIEIPYPDFIINILSIFRSSGRFIWCLDYLVFFFVIMTLGRSIGKKQGIFLLMFALCFQIRDMEPMIQRKQDYVNRISEYQTFKSEDWERVAQGKTHLVLLPYHVLMDRNNISLSYEIGNFAIDHHMTINYFPVARVDVESITSNEIKILENNMESLKWEETLFILDSFETAEKMGITPIQIDDFIVGVLQ